MADYHSYHRYLASSSLITLCLGEKYSLIRHAVLKITLVYKYICIYG